ncbi:MAG TPA: nucleotidyltransferase domain-containing protein [Thermoanaerobaculia bacterium]|nr:nucleotidyltransferase domain-containing protein [Thermoanaerobaculia bacterium]
MDNLPARIKDVIAELRRGLQDLYGERFRDLLLYGSYARGEADEGSDVDLLLLLEGPVNPVKEIVRMEPVTWPLSLDSELLLSVMPVNFQDFQTSRTSFLSTVRKEAIPAA